MGQSFLTVAQQGKNNWWRYLLGFLLIFFCWMIVGSIVAIVVVQLFVSDLQQQPPILAYAASKVADAFSCVGVFLAVRWLHKRPFLTLISPEGSVDIKRFFFGFWVWLLLLTLSLWVGVLLIPQKYSFTFNPNQWFQLLPLALVLTPIQSAGEELIFRGYLLQGLGCITRQKFVLILVNAILFALPHLLRPISWGLAWAALFSFAGGVFFTVITLKDNRLELALGVHAATNLYAVLLVNGTNWELPTIWKFNSSDPRWSVICVLILMVVFYWVFQSKHIGKRKTLE